MSQSKPQSCGPHAAPTLIKVTLFAISLLISSISLKMRTGTPYKLFLSGQELVLKCFVVVVVVLKSYFKAIFPRYFDTLFLPYTAE